MVKCTYSLFLEEIKVMKIDWNRRYNTIAAYALIVIVLSISFFLVITRLDAVSEKLNAFTIILKPFIIGFSLAYLLNFVMDYYESRFLNKIKMRFKVRRLISLLMTYATLFVVLALFIRFVVPQMAESASKMLVDAPNIGNRFFNTINDISFNLDLPDEVRVLITDKLEKIARSSLDFLANLMPQFVNFLMSIAKGVWNTVLGLIISIYILADKEGFFAMCKKFITAVFSESRRDRILYITRLTDQIFGKFIVGKIIDSSIIAVITFIVLSLTDMPYKILLTFIIGVTNVIPFFGPFIGAIPSIFIVLLVDPSKALWMTLIIFAIQQLDGNVIGPKILGDSIGISSFWILFSLLLAGKFFGIVGMIVGVPVFAVVYTIIGESVNFKLKKKGLPVSKDEYK